MSEKVDDLIAGLEAERDTALAAINRVRALHTGPSWAHFDLTLEQPHERCDGCTPLCLCANVWPCPTITALAETPEAEWEWAVRAPGDDEPFSDIYPSRENLAEQETGIAWGDEQLVRRRKAGPWLPVEGESDGV